jgi:HEAT repeat protein
MVETRQNYEHMVHSLDEEMRLQGLREIARIGAADSLATLYAALGDASWRVRKEAVEIFLGLPAAWTLSGEIADFLHSQDNAGLRNAAVDILTRLGRHALPCLLEELACNDHDVRKFALDILGEIRDPAAVGSMISALRDPDGNVRAAAAENLGKLGTAEAIPALLAVLGEADLLLRFTILEALAQIGGEMPLAPLLTLGEEPLLRQALFDCLGKIGQAEAVPRLVDGLLDPMANVREAATLALGRTARRVGPEVLDALGELAGEAHAEVLAQQLENNDPEVRRAAAALLGRCGSQRQVRRLLELFADDALRDDALAALTALGRIATCSLTELWDDADERTRTYLAYVYGEAGCAEGRVHLCAGLGASDPDLRLVCIRSLGLLGDRTALAPLLGALHDDREDLVEAAVQALCRIAPGCREEALAALRPLLEAGDAQLRVAAVTVLGELDGAEIVPTLNFALKDEAALVRRGAVRAIEKHPGTEQVPALMIALTDEDPEVRRLAAEALGTSGGSQAVHALGLALKDEDIWVRAAAVRSLGRLGGEESRCLVRSSLADPVGLIGIAALETMALLDPGTVHRHAVPALDHPDEEVVIAAIKLLVAEGRSDWLAPVGDRLLHHCHWEVRVNFARALAELQGESCRDLLENRLLVEDQDLVREQFQDLLAALQQPRR